MLQTDTKFEILKSEIIPLITLFLLKNNFIIGANTVFIYRTRANDIYSDFVSKHFWQYFEEV